MKIAHVVDSMEVGGAETIVAQLCRWQRQQGHEPLVFAHLRDGALGERLKSEGFHVEVIGPAHIPAIQRLFYRAFRQHKPDVVHCHNPTPTIYAAIPGHFAGAKTVISTRHSLVAPPYNNGQEIKFGIAARFCDAIVGICDATVENLRHAPLAHNGRLLRIYNGAEPLARLTNPPDSDPFVFVYVGRLAPVKNHETMLRGFAIASSSNPALRLRLVGDGPSRTSLENLARELKISDRAEFVGQQLNVAPFMNSAHAFVMSSRSEGLPMSLLQAMSIGLPAIVTDVGGMAEVVRLSQCGLTVPVAQPEEYAKALLSMAADSQKRDEFSRSALSAFDRWFTLEAMAKSYMDLYSRRMK